LLITSGFFINILIAGNIHLIWRNSNRIRLVGEGKSVCRVQLPEAQVITVQHGSADAVVMAMKWMNEAKTPFQ